MENLMEIVAASFARHRIECPGDSAFASGPMQASPATVAPNSTSTTSAPERVALPAHNYRITQQGDPAP